MTQVIRVLYIVLVGYLFYRMFRGGGCCGGHSHGKKTGLDEMQKEETRIDRIMSEDEKRKAIEIEPKV